MSIVTSRRTIDPLQTALRPGWRPVELVLAVIVVSGWVVVQWMIAAYTPSDAGDANITKGMSHEEVLVVLGEPNERNEPQQCWNYDRFHHCKDRFCIQFDDQGRVKKTSR